MGGMLMLAAVLAQQPAPQGADFVPYVLATDDSRQRVPAELGRLLVPENRGNAASRRIELRFVRLRGRVSPGTPLIVLAGGPGGSGITMGRRPSLLAFAEAARELGDVIFLDQRGTGMSLTLECPGRWELPLDRPMTRESLVSASRDYFRGCAAFWTEQGADLRGYTTAESADDVDAIRSALGASKMNLYGASYGSHLALATLKRHGDKVNRALIPMVEGPDHTIKLPSNVQKQMETIAARVGQDADWSRIMPDFLATVASVLGRLERTPAVVELDDPAGPGKVRVSVGKFDLQKFTAQGLGNLAFLRRLPARYRELESGDYRWLAQEALKLRSGEIPDNAMSYVMDCASGLSAPRRQRIRAEAATTLLGDAIDLPWPDVCSAWPHPDLGDDFRANPKSAVPVLFMSGTLDGRTPESNALEVAAGFPNSHHILVDGMSHGHPRLFTELGPVMLGFLRGQGVTIRAHRFPFAFDRP